MWLSLREGFHVVRPTTMSSVHFLRLGPQVCSRGTRDSARFCQPPVTEPIGVVGLHAPVDPENRNMAGISHGPGDDMNWLPPHRKSRAAERALSPRLRPRRCLMRHGCNAAARYHTSRQLTKRCKNPSAPIQIRRVSYGRTCLLASYLMAVNEGYLGNTLIQGAG